MKGKTSNTLKKTKQRLSEEQQQELQKFVEKIRTLQPSEQQQAIFEKAKTGKGCYVINAGPGSGKTFTSIYLSQFFPDSAIYFSYNKKIQIDTNHKLTALGSKMVATTSHSFGLNCLNSFFGYKQPCQLDHDKYTKIVQDYMDKHWNGFLQSIRYDLSEEELEKNDEWAYDARSWSKTLIKYHQLSMCGLDPISIRGLVEQFDLNDINPKSPIWTFVHANVSQAIEEGKQQFWDSHIINFEDMIYYPALFTEIPVPTYDHIIIDEAQDTSETALNLILRACHKDSQIFAVGDPRQSIYIFAGAKEDSIPFIIQTLRAEVLPLRTCYRCGSRIVDLANQLNGQLIPAGSHEGSVDVVEAEHYFSMLQPGNAVIGRTTKRLVKDCLHVLQTGQRATVLGRNIGDSITGILSKIESKRARRGIPALDPNLLNFTDLLEEYEREQRKNILDTKKKNPELAVSEMLDRVETARVLYSAYITKCNDPTKRRETDPTCAFSKTPKDFKAYIKGLFTEDENSSMIQFMTAHRSKGLEFERVFIIGTDEFPHPKAKSNQQQRQEENLMYVAITRAINELYFVEAPFTSVTVPDYKPNQERGLTIVSFPAIDHLEIHPNSEPVVLPVLSSYDHDEENEDQPTAFSRIGTLDDLDYYNLDRDENEDTELPFITTEEPQPTPSKEAPATTTTPAAQEIEPQSTTTGKVSKALAIEVLCPICDSRCVNRESGSHLITQDLVGHTIVCSKCQRESTVPLNAFSLIGNIIAREKLATGKPNNRVEKVGRTKHERKSSAGRKTKSGIVRQPMQLSLDVRTITTLNTMGVNKSELYELLLQQYEPFVSVWGELGNEDYQEDEDTAD